MRKINQRGLFLIKSFEGLRLEPYLCPAGKLTIGYGHVLQEGEIFGLISEGFAEHLLMKDLERFEQAVEALVTVKLNDDQFAALVSFCFNVGIGAFKRSRLLNYLNRGLYRMAGCEFSKWVHAGGRRLSGLVRRRDVEADLFFSLFEVQDEI